MKVATRLAVAVCTSSFAVHVTLAFLCGGVCLAVCSATNADDSRAVQGVTRRVSLDGPGGTGARACDVVQVVDSGGAPREYLMDVDSVVCADAQCEIVTVRIHFDPLGGYERYELPAGGNLTKWGHQPFSPADHQKLHQILADPYSPLKSVGWDQITLPGTSAFTTTDVDGISGATVLSKRSLVVVGAAYTCCTLWHWSHGQVQKVIREMTAAATDRQNLIRHLHGGQEKYVVFAAEQLESRTLFDSESISAVVHVVRHGSDKLADPAFRYLAAASRDTGVDCFFRCVEEECLVADSGKRIQFLEALRETTQHIPAGYLERLGSWLPRADSYYEVHLLFSLLERDNVTSDCAVSEALLLLEHDNSLVARRSYRYLKAQTLDDAQQERLESFERSGR
jgi:hypothetical protein